MFPAADDDGMGGDYHKLQSADNRNDRDVLEGSTVGGGASGQVGGSRRHQRVLLDAYGDSLKTVALMLWKSGYGMHQRKVGVITVIITNTVPTTTTATIITASTTTTTTTTITNIVIKSSLPPHSSFLHRSPLTCPT